MGRIRLGFDPFRCCEKRVRFACSVVGCRSWAPPVSASKDGAKTFYPCVGIFPIITLCCLRRFDVVGGLEPGKPICHTVPCGKPRSWYGRPGPRFANLLTRGSLCFFVPLPISRLRRCGIRLSASKDGPMSRRGTGHRFRSLSDSFPFR